MNEDKLLQALLDDLEDESEVADEPERGKTVRLLVRKKSGEAVEDACARAALTPEYGAAGSIFQLNQVSSAKEADLTKLADRLEHQTQQIKDGDLGQADSMLSAHASTLDALFHNLLLRSAMNAGNNFDVGEKLMKLALKAQSQCRATLDSLASMKNPAVHMRQTNIAHNQQINNGQKIEKSQSKLLEKTDGERLDTRATQESVRGDQSMETVGEIDGTEDT